MSMGGDPLGWPAAWPQRSTAVWVIRIVFGLLLAAVFAVVAVVVIVLGSAGNLGVGFVAAAPACMLLPTIAMQLFLLRTRFRKLPRALRAEGAGTTETLFLPDISEIAGLVTAAVMIAVLVPFVWAQTLQSSHAADELPVLRVFLAIEWLMVGAIVLFAILLGWNWRTVRPGLQISATGVRRQTLMSDRTITWDQLFRVDPERGARLAVWLVGSARFRVRRTGLFSSDPREKTWAEPLIAVKYRIDPPLLLAILRYYHLHPEHRAELDSPAAAQRIRALNFPGINLAHDPGVPRAQMMRYAIRGQDARQ